MAGLQEFNSFIGKFASWAWCPPPLPSPQQHHRQQIPSQVRCQQKRAEVRQLTAQGIVEEIESKIDQQQVVAEEAAIENLDENDINKSLESGNNLAEEVTGNETDENGALAPVNTTYYSNNCQTF